MVSLDAIRKFEVSAFDMSSSDPRYLICYNDRHFEVGQSVADLVGILQQSDSLKEATQKFSESRNTTISAEQMEGILEKCIKPILEAENTPQRKPFIVKFEIIPAKVVSIASKAVKFLFKPVVAITLIGLILGLHIAFYTSPTSYFLFGELDILTIIGVLAIFVLSSCFHELGHAAACQYFGISHGGVGFGLYISFPVLYTDVSGVWKLPRKKRLIVNMAGVYFQLIFLIPLLIVFLFTGNQLIKYFIMTVNFNFIFTLNPFFKFDGYWIVSDLSGVPNLRLRTREVMKYYVNKLRRKSAPVKPFLFSLKPVKKTIMLVYSTIMNLFFLFVFGFIIPRFLFSFFENFPALLSDLVSMIAVGQSPSFTLVKTVITQALMFGFMVFAVYRALKPHVMRILAKRKAVRAA